MVFRDGRRRAGAYLVMWVRDGAGTGDCRVATVAGKRTLRRAVDRSRAKRLLREAFRLNRPLLRPDTDFVLVARRAILGARLGDVGKDLISLARGAGVLAAGACDEGAVTEG
jgi:ribonuclease P protein component